MNPVSWVLVYLGVFVILLAAIGLIKFRTPYARIHAAGKASPIAFLLVAVAIIPEVGWGGSERLVIATGALVLTLPVAVHLLFRAIHASDPSSDPEIDELRHRVDGDASAP